MCFKIGFWAASTGRDSDPTHSMSSGSLETDHEQIILPSTTKTRFPLALLLRAAMETLEGPKVQLRNQNLIPYSPPLLLVLRPFLEIYQIIMEVA